MQVAPCPRTVFPQFLLTFKRNKLLVPAHITKKIFNPMKSMIKEFSTRMNIQERKLRQKTFQIKPILKVVNETTNQLMKNLQINEKAENDNPIVKKTAKVGFSTELTRVKLIPRETRTCFVPLGPRAPTPCIKNPQGLTKNAPQANIKPEEIQIVSPKVNTFNSYIAKQKQITDQTQTLPKTNNIISPPITEKSLKNENSVPICTFLSVESLYKPNEVEENIISDIEANETVNDDNDNIIDDVNIKEEPAEYEDQVFEFTYEDYSDSEEESDDEEIDFSNLDALYLRIKSSEDMLNHVSRYNQYLNDEYSKNTPRWRIMYERTGKKRKLF
jgi:hypothetical protein